MHHLARAKRRSHWRSQPLRQVLFLVLFLVLCKMAHAAAHSNDTSLSALSTALRLGRGTKKALVALEPMILVSAYHVVAESVPYHELGGNCIDEHERRAWNVNVFHA